MQTVPTASESLAAAAHRAQAPEVAYGSVGSLGVTVTRLVVTVEGVSVETPKPNARCGEDAEQAGLRATTPFRIYSSEYQLPNTPMRHSRVPSS